MVITCMYTVFQIFVIENKTFFLKKYYIQIFFFLLSNYIFYKYYTHNAYTLSIVKYFIFTCSNNGASLLTMTLAFALSFCFRSNDPTH